MLTFENAAVAAKVATPAESYTLQWFRFDNASDTRADVGQVEVVRELRARAPAELTTGGADYVGVTMTARHSRHPKWTRPATFYFRKLASGWQPVGIER